jgi:hypothetical protein
MKYPQSWFLVAAAISTTSCSSDVAAGGSDGGAGGSDFGGAAGDGGAAFVSCEQIETQAECEAAPPTGDGVNYCGWGTPWYVSSIETCDVTEAQFCFSLSTSGNGFCEEEPGCPAVPFDTTYFYRLSGDGGVLFTYITHCGSDLHLTSNGWKKCTGDPLESEPEICSCICNGEVQ